MPSPPTRLRVRLGRRVPVEVYTQPFELALGLALVINGVRALIGGLSPSVSTLPPLPLYLYVIVSTIGGAGVTVGLLFGRPTPDHPVRVAGLRVERASLYLVAASYAVLLVVIFYVNRWAGFQTGILLALFVTACLLRTVAIRKTARVVIDTLVAANREASP